MASVLVVGKKYLGAKIFSYLAIHKIRDAWGGGVFDQGSRHKGERGVSQALSRDGEAKIKQDNVDENL